MTLVYTILLSLIFISLGFSSFTFFKLFKWNKDFTAWEKNLINNSSLDNRDEINHDYVPSNLLMENTLVTPVDNIDTELNLHSLINEDSIIVFLDKSCSLCNGNFEEFVHINKENYSSKDRIVILFNREQQEAALLFDQLYDSQFSVFLLNDSEYVQSIKASFFPIYTKVDSKFNITVRTPSPVLVTVTN